MARRAAEDVTETELAILQVLWERGEATLRQIADVLCPGGGEAYYATVQKLLWRMEGKGFVRRDGGPRSLLFTATVGRDELITRRLQGLADQLCGGAMTPLVMNLVRTQSLSAAEVDELSAFLRQERRRAKSRGDQA